jgi:transcriptional regulator with XRE-family HTH domain
MRLAAKLKKLRTDSGRSRQAVADHITKAVGEVSESTVRRRECGKAVPDLREAAALACLFGVSVDHLADDTQDEPRPALTEAEAAAVNLVQALDLSEAEVLRRLSTPSGGRVPMVREPIPGAAGPAPADVSPGTAEPARPPAATPQSPPRRADRRNSG